MQWSESSGQRCVTCPSIACPELLLLTSLRGEVWTEARQDPMRLPGAVTGRSGVGMSAMSSVTGPVDQRGDVLELATRAGMPRDKRSMRALRRRSGSHGDRLF